MAFVLISFLGALALWGLYVGEERLFREDLERLGVQILNDEIPEDFAAQFEFFLWFQDAEYVAEVLILVSLPLAIFFWKRPFTALGNLLLLAAIPIAFGLSIIMSGEIFSPSLNIEVIYRAIALAAVAILLLNLRVRSV